MKIKLMVIGKTAFDYLNIGINDYSKRISKYSKFEIQILPDVKNAKSLSIDILKSKEAEIILKNVSDEEVLILLDENGKTFNSINFAKYIDNFQINSTKSLIFLIGGAFGFNDAVYKRANAKISLSEMTFSHQIIRLIFLEQLYRAFTIIKNEPYHHE